MNEIIRMLEEGAPKSIGRVPEVLNMVEDRPDLFPKAIQAMAQADPGNLYL